MHSYLWQRNKTFLLTLFFIAAYSFRTVNSLQSRRFFEYRRDSKVLNTCCRLGTCYRAFREKGNAENESTEDDSITPSHISLNNEKVGRPSRRRRNLLLSTSSSLLGLSGICGLFPARAINGFGKRGLYLLNTRDALSEASLSNEQVEVFPKLSSECALLRVLPVKNSIFRTVEQNLEALSVLRYLRETSTENTEKAWARADSSVDTALSILTNKRNQLQPVFNPDDSNQVAKVKTERGEKLLDNLKEDLEYLKESIAQRVGAAACT